MDGGVRLPGDRQRFLDVSEEPDKLIAPIPMPVTGSKGLLSLRECVKPVENLNLVGDLSNKVAYSLKKCEHPKDGLTQDQSAALYLYSLPGSFYEMFNGVLRAEDRTKSIPFHDYYRLFMSALNKLPSIQEIVWRGVTADLSHQYRSGTVHVWNAASSCTDEVSVTDTFLDKKKHRTLFHIKCYNGKTIKNHSHYPKESETILPPGTFIRVKSQSNPAENLFIVACEETKPTPEEMNALSTTGIAAAALPGSMPTVVSTTYLFWVDLNINKSQDNVKTQEKLQALFTDDFHTFETPEECESCIKQKKNDQIILIVGGQIGRRIVPRIHDLTQMSSVLVYCMDKEGNEKWAKNYGKVKAVLTRPNELIEEVERQKELQALNLTDQNDTLPTVKTIISGYEEYPLQSLEKALEPVDQFMEDLARYVYMARENCRNPSDGLTRDESASIMIFTMEMNETSLYRVFNTALRSEERQRIKPWFPYLKIFMTALHKLPSFRGVVWRGINGNVTKSYTKGQRAFWWGVTSASTNGSVIEEFVSQSGERAVFTIECKNGKCINNHSYFPADDEVLLMPGFYYEVTSVFKPATDMHIIGLKEIDLPW